MCKTHMHCIVRIYVILIASVEVHCYIEYMAVTDEGPQTKTF